MTDNGDDLSTNKLGVIGTEPRAQRSTAVSLEDVHRVFRRWMGETYDLDVIDAACAAAAVEHLDGDPLWLLVVGGPGSAKTETIQALAGAGGLVISTIASEGALISASPKKSRAKDATGGLLMKIGDSGVLVIKDVTTILSADRNLRGTVLAALREVYDGRWIRNVGTDGGATLTWEGRIIVVGAVTTAWDAAHAVVAAMGDRFVLIRINSNNGRMKAGMQAMRNTGSEVEMRGEMAAVVGALIENVNTDDVEISDDERERLLRAANIVTMARTPVERDYQGNVTYAHAPEAATRFGKQLIQLVRGGMAVGMAREAALKLAIRCARDSIPPMRLEVLLDVIKHPYATPNEVRKRISRPWTSTKRELEGLHILGVLDCDEETEEPEDTDAKPRTTWLYVVNERFDGDTLLAMAGQERPPTPEQKLITDKPPPRRPPPKPH